MEVFAIIYCITCTKNDKQYVGQTRTHKLQKGKWQKYGLDQRFTDHLGAAKRGRTTPLAKALRKYGEEYFELAELERCPLEDSDEREAYYIKELDTIKPNGYNVQRSSRFSKGSYYIEGDVIEAEVKGIKENGSLSKIRVLLTIDGQVDKTRVMFSSSSFEENLKEAVEFCNSLDPERIIMHSSLEEKEESWWPYKEKIEALEDRDITKVDMVLFNKTMVRVNIKTADMESWKETIHYAFGGKTVPLIDAYEKAVSVCDELYKRYGANYTINSELTKNIRSATDSCLLSCQEDSEGETV